jgi:hypothetical protein
MHDVALLFGIEHRPERRHHAVAPVDQRGLDGLGLAAVQPVAVGKVGETTRTPRIRAMALGAVVQVEALAHGARIRIGGDCLGVHLGVTLEQRSDLGIGNADFALMALTEVHFSMPSKRPRPG